MKYLLEYVTLPSIQLEGFSPRKKFANFLNPACLLLC